MSNWLLNAQYDDNPIITPTDTKPGRQECGCCVVFATRREAKELELSLLRSRQRRIQEELAGCENHIVSVMRELGIDNNSDNRRV